METVTGSLTMTFVTNLLLHLIVKEFWKYLGKIQAQSVL